MPTKIVIGGTYGMLTVEAATSEKDYRGRTLYRCACTCGGVRLVAADRLLAGSVISCGCLYRKAQADIGGSKERNGWTPEQEAARIAKVMTGCTGIYQRGKSFIAQIKIKYKTHYIGSYDNRDDALAARQEVVRTRIEQGNAAAVEYIAELKKARHEKPRLSEPKNI